MKANLSPSVDRAESLAEASRLKPIARRVYRLTPEESAKRLERRIAADVIDENDTKLYGQYPG